MKTAAIFPKFLLLCLLAATAVSCTQSSNPPAPTQAASKLFDFETSKVLELDLALADPEAGASWSARLRNDPSDPAGGWSVAAAPDGATVADNRANASLIRHFLDTLQTLHLVAPAASASDYGLNPPRYWVKWRTPSRAYELKIGATAPGSDGRFATLVGSTSDGSRTWVVRGSAFELLQAMRSFSSLRLETISALPSDDVDELELSHGNRKLYYAQRENGGWSDAAHHPFKSDLGQLLDHLLHARVQEFIDDPAEARKLGARLQTDPDYRLTVKDRFGKANWVAAARIGGKLLTATSLRPGGVFVVSPEDFALFERAVH